MKKRFLILALCLLMMLAWSAQASSKLVSTVELDNVSDVILNQKTNVVAVRERKTGLYKLMAADGTDITKPLYSHIRVKDAHFEFSTTGIAKGLLDSAGNVLIPEEYGDILVASDRWYAGVRMTESSEENYDYKTVDFFSSEPATFYIVTEVDVYHCGQKVGVLERNQIKTDYTSLYAYGDYLCVQDRAGNPHFYDKNLVDSKVETGSTAEYSEDYRTGIVIHHGSGKNAFEAGCTLTVDEVEEPYFISNGSIYDLQGNVLLKTNYELREKIGNYVLGYEYSRDYKSLYGMLDMQGNIAIPFQYKRFNYDMQDNPWGIFQVENYDEKVGYVDIHGVETTEFKHSSSVARSGPVFTIVKDMEGNNIIIAAGCGELPGTYEEYLSNWNYCPIIALEKTTEEIGVVDLYGNEVIPFGIDAKSVSYIQMSDDGTLVIVRGSDYKCTVYSIAYEFANATVSAPVVTVAPIIPPAPTSVPTAAPAVITSAPVTAEPAPVVTATPAPAPVTATLEPTATPVAPTPEPTSAALSYVMGVTIDNHSRIRSGAGGKESLLMDFGKGVSIQVSGSVLADNGELWYIVQIDDITGYTYHTNVSLESAEWVCSGCSNVTTSKFCNNCGARRQCPECSFTPYGLQPKFCPECGAKQGQ